MLCPVTTVTNKSNPHGLIIIKKREKGDDSIPNFEEAALETQH